MPIDLDTPAAPQPQVVLMTDEWAVGATTSEPLTAGFATGQAQLSDGRMVAALVASGPFGQLRYMLEPVVAGELGAALTARAQLPGNTLLVLRTPYGPDCYTLKPDNCAALGPTLEGLAGATRSGLTIATAGAINGLPPRG
jgi:hypothetical protein